MKKKNKGAVQLEYVTIIVCVALVAFLGLSTFGGKISDMYRNVANAIGNNNVARPPEGGSGMGGGESGGSDPVIPEPEPEPVNPTVCDLDPFAEGKIRMTMLPEGDRDGDGEISVGDTIFFLVGGSPMKVSSSSVDKFRIVSIVDNKITFVALDSAASNRYNSSNNLIIYNNGQGQKYEGSSIDTFLTTTYYNKLPEAFRDILLSQATTQTSWSLGTEDANAEINTFYYSGFGTTTASGTNYSQTKIGYRDVETRKVLIPDVSDILNWLGEKPITPQNIHELFFDSRSSASSSSSIWLKSASADTSEAIYYDASTGKIGNAAVTNAKIVRPMFVIDGLSLNEWYPD